MRPLRAVPASLFCAFAAQMVCYFPKLPARMATYLNAATEADGWMPKSAYSVLFTCIFLFFSIKLSLLPALLERTPVELINTPERNFWLSGERKAAMLVILRQYFEWFTVAMMSVLLAVNGLGFGTDPAQNKLSDSILAVLILFLIFVGVWLTKLILRIRRVKYI